MALQAIAFYILAAATLIGGFLVVISKNPVHSVLFLFVVMMLDIDFAALRAGFVRYLPIGGAVAFVLAVEMVAVSITIADRGAAANTSPMAPGAVTNAEAIGRVLYTDYVYFFQASGLILLIAMIGAIVLTLQHRTGVRRQVIADQVARTPAKGMRVVQIKSGEALSE